SDQATGRNNLSLALSSLRRQLEPPDVARGSVVLADRLNVQLNPAVVGTDVAEFESRIAVALAEDQAAFRLNELAGAIELYLGPLLPGYYEEWIEPERERLQEAYLGALRRAAGLLAQTRQYPRALDYA